MRIGLRLVRFAALLVAASTPLVAGCSSVRWGYDFEEGMRKAAQERRRAIVQFYSLNRACHEMDREVFTEAEVQERMQEFVPIRLDYHLNRRLAEQFGVQVVPSFIVFRPDGQPAGSHAGKMDADKFKFFLITYRYN